MPLRSLINCLMVAVSLCCLSVSDSWALFTFSPIKLNLKPGKAAVTLTVSNPGEKTVLMQLETFKWNQKNGSDVLEATDELLAVPPVFTIAPHKTQIVRIAVPGRRQFDKEAAYRLFLTELPQKEETPEKSMVVGIAMRVNIPFFAKPRTIQQALAWSIQSSSPNRVYLKLENKGNIHAHLKKITILSYPERIPLTPDKMENSYILPDQSRLWTLDLGKPVTPKVVVVFEDVEHGSSEILLELNNGQGAEKGR